MIRIALLLLALIVGGRHWFCNAGTLKNGDWIVWVGTIQLCECGGQVALEWDHEGLIGYVMWGISLDAGGLYDAWTWNGARTIIDVKDAK